MYNTHQIINILANQKKELEKKFPISEMALFGSYARGDFNEHSDIDILVDFNKRIDGFDYIRIAHVLEDIFQHKIDLVSRKGIKPQYLSYVEKDLIHV
ncbi:MAG TPA: nucleotidyltransferase family protein [Hanamia sp.]|jgi:Predicted nucleotidyltransferases